MNRCSAGPSEPRDILETADKSLKFLCNAILFCQSNRGLFLRVNRGALIGGLEKNYNLTTPLSSFKYGAWNHVGMSFENATKKLAIYLNGEEAATKMVESFNDWSSNDLYVGKEENQHMEGFVDEIRIWKDIQNITSLFRMANLSSRDLLASYSLDEGEGNSAKDKTGKQSAANIHGPRWVRSFLPTR